MHLWLAGPANSAQESVYWAEALPASADSQAEWREEEGEEEEGQPANKVPVAETAEMEDLGADVILMAK